MGDASGACGSQRSAAAQLELDMTTSTDGQPTSSQQQLLSVQHRHIHTPNQLAERPTWATTLWRAQAPGTH